MYFTDKEIREELTAHAEEIRQNPDSLDEWADGFTPVYYSDIIKDWCELPREAENAWKELGYDANRNDGGILQLMAVDLTIYNLERTRRIWQQINSAHPCPNHAGAFDCTPFCELCEGEQEIAPDSWPEIKAQILQGIHNLGRPENV